MRHHGFLNLRPSSATGAGRDRRSIPRAHRLPFHISRRRPAPTWFDPGHSSRPFLARDVPDPQTRTSETWPGGQVLPSCRPAALLGLHPSQVCSRARVDARVNPAAKRIANCAFVRDSPSEASLLVRAHLPVDRSHVLPRLIFVGVSGRREKMIAVAVVRDISKSVRLLGFAPEFGPYRRQSYDAGDRSCHGLCLLQGCRPHARLPYGTDGSACSRTGSSPHRVTSLRPAALPPADPLMGVTASFPVEKPFRTAAAEMTLRLPVRLLSRRRAPALQRIVGLMPVRSVACFESRRTGSLSEVLHRP